MSTESTSDNNLNSSGNLSKVYLFDTLNLNKISLIDYIIAGIIIVLIIIITLIAMHIKKENNESLARGSVIKDLAPPGMYS